MLEENGNTTPTSASLLIAPNPEAGGRGVRQEGALKLHFFRSASCRARQALYSELGLLARRGRLHQRRISFNVPGTLILLTIPSSKKAREKNKQINKEGEKCKAGRPLQKKKKLSLQVVFSSLSRNSKCLSQLRQRHDGRRESSKANGAIAFRHDLKQYLTPRYNIRDRTYVMMT